MTLHKRIVVYPHNGILFISENEYTIAISKNKAESE